MLFKKRKDLERRIKKIEDEKNLKYNKKRAKKINKCLNKNICIEWNYSEHIGLGCFINKNKSIKGKLIAVEFDCDNLKLTFVGLKFGQYIFKTFKINETFTFNKTL